VKNDYGRVYRVTIQYNTALFENGEKFIDEVMPGVRDGEDLLKLESVDGDTIKTLWTVPEREGVHEIENELFYVLADGQYGSYSCEFVE